MPTKKRPTRKLKTGRRTVRTAGMSQSAFAGYGHQAPAQPPTPPQGSEDQEAPDSKDEPAEVLTQTAGEGDVEEDNKDEGSNGA